MLPPNSDVLRGLQSAATPRPGLLRRIGAALGFCTKESQPQLKSDEPWTRADLLECQEITSCEKPLSEMCRKAHVDR